MTNLVKKMRVGTDNVYNNSHEIKYNSQKKQLQYTLFFSTNQRQYVINIFLHEDPYSNFFTQKLKSVYIYMSRYIKMALRIGTNRRNYYYNYEAPLSPSTMKNALQ